MTRILIILTLMSLPAMALAQGDMLLLKKKGKVIRSYYPGSTIYFDIGGGPQKATIYQLKNDSLFLVQYQVRQVMTTLGTQRPDTVNSYRYGFGYDEIVKLIEPARGWDWHSAGTVLFGGGTLLTTAGLLTWVLAKKDSRYYARPEFVAVSAALAGIGYLLLQTNSGKHFAIGKKYSLQYISAK